MISTRDPETMTAEERRLEVAGILAAGLLRCIRKAETANPDARKISSPGSKTGLDLPAKTRLSVAQRPTG